MSYKEINLRSDVADTAITELKYEIASGRADSVDLVKIQIDLSKPEAKKIISHLIKALKSMKQLGSIQFFATESSFESMSTEAVFLLNKYPDLFTSVAKSDLTAFIYVKI